MNKSELIETLAQQENLTLKKAEMVVNAVFGHLAAALVLEKRIELRGFGSFKVKYHEGYTGRNPKTGEIIRIAGKKLPVFKVGKELGDLLNSPTEGGVQPRRAVSGDGCLTGGMAPSREKSRQTTPAQ